MSRLNYRRLRHGDVQVGQSLGCDSTGWPYRVESVEYDRDGVTRVDVEPWPIPGPATSELQKIEYLSALEHARDRYAGKVK